MRRFMILLLIGLALVACDQASAPRPNATQQPQIATSQSQTATPTGAYPAPANAYPAPTEGQSASGYPAPSALSQGPQFTINTPVRATDTQVTGTGGAGVPIKLVNVARSAETLGETTVGADGTFKIDIRTKLIAGDRIGLMLGNTQGTKFNSNDFISGPGYQDYPLVGILFASVVVE